jgi:hypothetical protein
MSDDTVFWENFQGKSILWASLLHSGSERLVFEEIDKLLNECGLPYCFDITHDDSLCYFILSPEGDKEFAKKIDELVMKSPTIPDWKVYGRRQRKPFEDVCAIVRQLYLIELSTTRFRLLRNEDAPFIQMFVSPDADLTPDERRGLINTFLWHFFGEDVAMNKHIRGEAILANPPSDGTLSPGELASMFSIPGQAPSPSW